MLCGDTLTLHDPDTLLNIDSAGPELLPLTDDDAERARRIQNATSENYLMDVAVGNPPYIGEKLAAPILRRTRQLHPYWEAFVGEHMDYLYWFLILGVSKVRPGGRFGFITTEYWLRSAGAKPLRAYLARRCQVDRIVVFRDFRLFPDAPGQHSMIVTGTRLAPPDAELDDTFTIAALKPKVSVYEGSSVTSAETREAILQAIRVGRSAARVRTFTAGVSPNTLGGDSWGDAVLNATHLRARRRLRSKPQVQIRLDKGVETTANALTAAKESALTAAQLAAVGGVGSRSGVQLLNPSEVTALGALNDAERKALRTWVNSRDIFPYATVVGPNASKVIYLAKSEAGYPRE